MKKDLIMGWVFIALALLMVFCVIVNIVNQNWVGLTVCGFAFGMNITSAISRFRDYKWRKEYYTHWPKITDKDAPQSTAGILSSGRFMDD